MAISSRVTPSLGHHGPSSASGVGIEASRTPLLQPLLKIWLCQIRRYTHMNGSWDMGQFVPAPYILLHINSGALHYGVSCFEGLKAFACKDGMIRMMNPALNAGRMQKGAIKLRMPEVPASTQ